MEKASPDVGKAGLLSPVPMEAHPEQGPLGSLTPCPPRRGSQVP